MLKLFPSIGFTICAILFLIIIIYMYFSKRKWSGIQNTIYCFMLVLTMIMLILELLCVYTISVRYKFPALNEVLCRLYILGVIIWTSCMIAYIYAITNRDKLKDSFKRQKEKFAILLSLIVSIFFSISCILPINYEKGLNNYIFGKDIYAIGGDVTLILYVTSFVLIVFLLISLIRNRKKLTLKQALPFYFTFFLFIVVTIPQLVTGQEFNDLTFIFSVSVVALYFTTESQDSKLLNDLIKSKEQVEETNKAKTEFLTNMSHKIRTPMNTILGFSESLLRENNLTKESIKDDVTNIHSASIELLDLINNILDISRIESFKEEKDEKEYNLKNLIFEVNSVVYSKLDKESVKFNINVDNNMPSVFYGDNVKISKIISNTIINAMKYTSMGSIDLNVSGLNDKDSYILKFEIVNTGHLMREEDFLTDFNDFVKLGNSAQNNIDGVTLGFIVAKRLLSIIDGKMEFKNEVGHGTRYFISIPQKVINENKIGNIFESISEENNNFLNRDYRGKKVLVVDDNMVNVKLAKRLLENYNIIVDMTTSGRDAIEKVKENKYDIIFLDHMMPELDGIATLKLLKEKYNDLPPIIALTANSYGGLREKYISYGFNDYISKPINVKELSKMLDTYLK